jgi:hypothetical protein
MLNSNKPLHETNCYVPPQAMPNYHAKPLGAILSFGSQLGSIERMFEEAITQISVTENTIPYACHNKIDTYSR